MSTTSRELLQCMLIGLALGGVLALILGAANLMIGATV